MERRAIMGAPKIAQLSGHSIRVGAAHDMLVAAIDLLGIMQNGGWREDAVLACGVENASNFQTHIPKWKRIEQYRHSPAGSRVAHPIKG